MTRPLPLLRKFLKDITQADRIGSAILIFLILAIIFGLNIDKCSTDGKIRQNDKQEQKVVAPEVKAITAGVAAEATVQHRDSAFAPQTVQLKAIGKRLRPLHAQIDSGVAKLPPAQDSSLTRAVDSVYLHDSLEAARGDTLAKDTGTVDSALTAFIRAGRPLVADDSSAHRDEDIAAAKLHTARVHEGWLFLGGVVLAVALFFSLHR